ncbi:hypothetical protein KZ336_10180, partial [Glaesserella parasuis]|nr:hypothetical protein [Glaesserella parasuis]MCT8613394.1 hypothetical protein [Glaesserella parasuis]MCT8817371.1 hypothetical protein [Glaesserella parasuis]MDD2168179.1 hypothetical protein [Glaesserella parasuis]
IPVFEIIRKSVFFLCKNKSIEVFLRIYRYILRFYTCFLKPSYQLVMEQDCKYIGKWFSIL